MSRRKRFLSLALCVCAPGWLGGAELLLNGEFEAGTGNVADAWTELIVGGGSTLQREAGAGQGAGFGMVGSVAWMSGTGTKTEVRQTTAMDSVTPGEPYVLGFSAKGMMGPGAVAWFQLLWLNSSGGVAGTTPLGNIHATLTGEYKPFGDTYTAPAGATAVTVSIRLEGGAFAGSSGNLTVDAVSLTDSRVDPEPSADLAFTLTREDGNLMFRWISRAGKVYDLRSHSGLDGTPGLWPLVLVGIPAVPGPQQQSIAQPADPNRFYVLIERDA